VSVLDSAQSGSGNPKLVSKHFLGNPGDFSCGLEIPADYLSQVSFH
jgi:hypothetical protein